MRGRATIGLYNSYDPRKLHEAHRRALARAGPIAHAYDFNVATFGFPYGKEMRTPADIVEWISGSTSIGEDGKYLVDLAQKGRFQAFDFPKGGFPPQLGLSVLTTCRPLPNKRMNLREACEMLGDGQSILLVFGLGPRGVPDEVFEMCERNMDITDKGVSLETCTALGAVPAAIWARLRH